MSLSSRLLGPIALAFVALTNLPAADFRLVLSQSGPSGTVVGSKYVFDEVRSRFVYPQDGALQVYFEWDGPPGAHVLTGLWKGPDGNTVQISPEVKIESKSRELTCYWTYTIVPDMAPGIWTVDIRIDGQPSGSHAFEIAGTQVPKPAPPPEVLPKRLTVEDIFRASSPSVVYVRKLEAPGRVIDTSLGFVWAKDVVVTAFQAVDGANQLEVEFAGGRKVTTDQLLSWSRANDLALVAVKTGEIPALSAGDVKQIGVGERLIAFSVENGAAAIGGVDISGRRTVPKFGERIQFSPAIPQEAAGGPLLNMEGKVVGVVGGSLTPGSRLTGRKVISNPSLRISGDLVAAVTPATAIPGKLPEKATPFSELLTTGILVAPISDMDGLIYATTSRVLTASAMSPLPREESEFSRTNKQVCVISEWQKKSAESKGTVSAKVYDDQNRIRVIVPPKKLSLPNANPSRWEFTFSPAQFTAGAYRIDLLWNDKIVWRRIIQVID